jgi:formylglycine-generating enzyme required for sulfatase activity
VLVLLPGGTFTMGARPPAGDGDRDAPNVDPHCRVRERPPHEVTLAPFFLGKHEITQAQWTRQLGWNPSGGGRGSEQPRELLPADSMGRAEAYSQMRRIGLTLPTEAQWEYGARGGTGTIWWTGNDPLALDRAANLLDWSWLQHSKEPVPDGTVELRLDDGFAGPAPIGSFLPNGFGLHDVIGNLMEHVLDFPAGYDVAPAPGDGMRTGTLDLAKVKERGIRGGSFQTGVAAARSAHRDVLDAYSPALGIGFRAARPLLPD